MDLQIKLGSWLHFYRLRSSEEKLNDSSRCRALKLSLERVLGFSRFFSRNFNGKSLFFIGERNCSGEGEFGGMESGGL